MDLSFAGSTRTWGSLDQNQFSRLHLFPPFNGFTLWSRAWGFHALLPQKCACSPKIPVLSLFPLKTLFISEIQQLLPKFLWCLLNLIYFIALWKSYFSFQDQHLCDVPRGLFVGFCVCSCWFVFLDFLKSDLKVFCLFLFFFLSFFFLKTTQRVSRQWDGQRLETRTPQQVQEDLARRNIVSSPLCFP